MKIEDKFDPFTTILTSSKFPTQPQFQIPPLMNWEVGRGGRGGGWVRIKDTKYLNQSPLKSTSLTFMFKVKSVSCRVILQILGRVPLSLMWGFFSGTPKSHLSINSVISSQALLLEVLLSTKVYLFLYLLTRLFFFHRKLAFYSATGACELFPKWQTLPPMTQTITMKPHNLLLLECECDSSGYLQS